MDDATLRRNAFVENSKRIAKDCDMQKNMERLADMFAKLVMKKKYSSFSTCD
jgi:hypothetical protein